MAKQHGPWKIKDTRLTYRNDFIKVSEDHDIKLDGTPGVYATVGLRAGVCVLPMDEDGSIYLTTQYRYALGEESLEWRAALVLYGSRGEEE